MLEETGVTVTNVRVGTFTNDVFKKENKHYITVFVVAELGKGAPKVMEKDKCEKWEWFGWSDLPENVFLPIQNLIKTDFSPFD